MFNHISIKELDEETHKAFNAGRAEGRVEGAEIMLVHLLDHVNKMFHGTNEIIKTTPSKAERTACLKINGALASIIDMMRNLMPTVPTMFDEVTAEERELAAGLTAEVEGAKVDNSSENS
jgi:hypothetical protein